MAMESNLQAYLEIHLKWLFQDPFSTYNLSGIEHFSQKPAELYRMVY